MNSIFNWIDFLILIIFIIYIYDGYRRGFLRLIWELLGIILAFILALKFYTNVATLIQMMIPSSDLYIKPIAFLIAWFLVQLVFYIGGHYLSFYTPVALKESKANHLIGLIPAAFKGIIFIAVLLVLLMILPISSGLKGSIQESLIGNKLVEEASKTESKMEAIFSGGEVSAGTLTGAFLSESSKLDFTATDTKIDEQSEEQMLSLINEEREKAGLKPVQSDILLRNVARSHSRDMLIRGYFSHDSPTGETLSDRLKNAQVIYVSAAENIAMAPTIELAHTALMNSPKHKDNILNPSFTHVGIGVIDAGEHGLMVTQNFMIQGNKK